jgi:hypothetical protein
MPLHIPMTSRLEAGKSPRAEIELGHDRKNLQKEAAAKNSSELLTAAALPVSVFPMKWAVRPLRFRIQQS